jgi:hypothetical protein
VGDAAELAAKGSVEARMPVAVEIGPDRGIGIEALRPFASCKHRAATDTMTTGSRRNRRAFANGLRQNADPGGREGA